VYGKAIRLRRLFPSEGRRLFAVPLDHSVSLGPIDGLERPAELATTLQASGVDLLLVTKGAVRDIAPVLRPSTLLGVHLSASTSLGPRPNLKVLVGTAAEAVQLGADLVSVQVNFGTADEGTMLSDLGTAVDQCRSVGVPLLCMAYVKKEEPPTPSEIRHVCRAAADLGADIVKTSYPGSEEEFRALVRSTPVPVLLGGGERIGGEAALIARVQETVRVGARGICFGRNLFQRRRLPSVARRVGAILHGTAS